MLARYANTISIEHGQPELTCADESPKEAVSFTKYCVHEVAEEFTRLSCRVGTITCKVEEMDMSWLDELEDMAFRPKL